MTERRYILEWISLTMSALAVAISGASAYFTWQANQLKAESVAVTVLADPTCPLVLSTDRTSMMLCWTVMLSNRSEIKTSVINYFISRQESFIDMEKARKTSDVSDINLLPIDIDGGSTKKLFMSIRHYMRANVASAVAHVIERENSREMPLTIYQMDEDLWRLGMDLFGNVKQGRELTKYENPTYYLQIITGKGQYFTDDFRWYDYRISPR